MHSRITTDRQNGPFVRAIGIPHNGDYGPICPGHLEMTRFATVDSAAVPIHGVAILLTNPYSFKQAPVAQLDSASVFGITPAVLGNRSNSGTPVYSGPRHFFRHHRSVVLCRCVSRSGRNYARALPSSTAVRCAFRVGSPFKPRTSRRTLHVGSYKPLVEETAPGPPGGDRPSPDANTRLRHTTPALRCIDQRHLCIR